MLTKPEFVDIMAERTEITKKSASEMYDYIFGTMAELISEGYEIAVPSLGRVKYTVRKARTGRNPSTGEVIQIPEKRAPHFQFSKPLKDAVASL